MINKKIVFLCLLMSCARVQVSCAMDTNAMKDFECALDKQDFAAVDEALKKGATIDGSAHYDGETPLGKFTRERNEAIVAWLLKKGANPNKKNTIGLQRTPFLQIPTRCRETMTIAQSFLEHGVDVNAADCNGRTLLMTAAATDDQALAELLLKNNKLAIDQQDNYGRTALMYAAVHGSWSVLRVLVSHRANVNLVGSDGQSVLMASLQGRTNVDKGPWRKYLNKIGNQVIDWALNKFDFYPTIELLLQYGANVNHRDVRGYTALMYAAMACDRALINLLLQYHADKDITDKEGRKAADLFKEAAALRGTQELAPELA